jgi:hypothetical protein
MNITSKLPEHLNTVGRRKLSPDCTSSQLIKLWQIFALFDE